MDIICPICNGLIEENIKCKLCGEIMIEKGKIIDYSGSYSPNMDLESYKYNNTTIMNGDSLCIHLFYCDKCNEWQYKGANPEIF